MPERPRGGQFDRVFRRARETAYLMVGIPSYERYAAHRRAHHPGQPIMTLPEFMRERTARRFGGGVGRCC